MSTNAFAERAKSILFNLKECLTSYDALYDAFNMRGYLRHLPTPLFLRLYIRRVFGHSIDLKHPKTFNEKLQYLKLHDHNPLYTQLADKYAVRAYVADKIGGEYLIPLIGVWDSPDEIDFDQLPEQFVLKATHDSGSIYVCRDKKTRACVCKDKKIIAFEDVKKQLAEALSRNFYCTSREWPYKNIRPRIICERYIAECDGADLKDHRFFCFDGTPKAVSIDIDTLTNHRRNFYNPQWERLPCALGYPAAPDTVIPKPENFDDMLRIAGELSKGIPHVRVDLYNIGGKIYFAELTFFHANGSQKFTPPEWDVTFGDWLSLDNVYDRRAEK